MISVEKISNLVGGEIIGDKTYQVKGICDIEKGKNACITYLSSNKYIKYLKSSNASVFIVDNNFPDNDFNNIFIKVENPSYSFIEVINMFHPQLKSENSISSSSEISKNAQLGDNLYIGPNVVIEENVIIEENVCINSGSFIGRNTKIGKNTKLLSNVTIYNDVEIGKNCKIDSGTIIGADGFGLAKENGKNISIPHTGKVIIKDDVFIGANCCVDRGTINDTIINENCRLDNFIQVGHNVRIGIGCVIAAQVGIAGSTIIEDNVTIAGQVGIVDHIVVGENSVVTAKSLVCNSVQKNSFLSGNPAQPHRDFLKQQVILRNLNNSKNRF